MPSSKASQAQQESTTSLSLSKRNRHAEPPSAKLDASAPKRHKKSHSAANTDKLHGMLRNGGGGSGGGGVLGRIMADTSGRIMADTSGFQPQTGAKRLVIKNLRKSAPANLDDYYAKTWRELDAALTAIFDRKAPETPLELLCRGVEATCRGGKAEPLFRHLEKRCKTHLDMTLLSRIEKNAQSNVVELLRAVMKAWRTWNHQLVLIRSLFSYLDRAYLLVTRGLPQLEEMGVHQFRATIFGDTGRRTSLGTSTIQGICSLVNLHRRGQHDPTDASLLKASITTIHILGVYGSLFEGTFQESSESYFNSWVTEEQSASLDTYVIACDGLLQRERERCDVYNLDASTKNRLLDNAHRILIAGQSEILLDPAALFKLWEEPSIERLKMLYHLLRLSKIEEDLKGPWEKYMETTGEAIVKDKERVDDQVVRILQLKRTLELINRDAFDRNDVFKHSLRDSFGRFMNARRSSQKSDMNSKSVAEMIAKYIDMLLRGGMRAVPRSLMSDSTHRKDAEMQGQSSTADEDAEFDRQLDNALELFRFIEGKDVFEKFYQNDLARRLLLARSASQDAERSMIAKLRAECGTNFTHNLEQMFKDQELARDEMIAYKQSLSNTSKTTLDLQVSVLSAAAWPTYPDVQVNLPGQVARHIEKYDAHYKLKHTGRRLTWKHALAHSVVKAHFPKGSKELLVSAFQAIVLVLFNDLGADDNLSYVDIAKATGLVDAELQRTLQSLACAKLRVLNKHPKGRDVHPSDTFTVNLAFSDAKMRVKINQIQLKETKEENKATYERVAQDRQYETQAAIVRIMKSRKVMTHANLVAEVITQTKGRGAVELPEIKKNIEKLIEKDYIERDGSSYNYLA